MVVEKEGGEGVAEFRDRSINANLRNRESPSPARTPVVKRWQYGFIIILRRVSFTFLSARPLPNNRE